MSSSEIVCALECIGLRREIEKENSCEYTEKTTYRTVNKQTNKQTNKHVSRRIGLTKARVCFVVLKQLQGDGFATPC